MRAHIDSANYLSQQLINRIFSKHEWYSVAHIITNYDTTGK